MSNVENPQPNPTPSTEPPPLYNTQGGLDPRQRLAPRRVEVATFFQEPVAGEVSEIPGQPGYVNYTGQNLVNSKGQVVRTQYSATYDEAYRELAAMSPAERKGLLQALYKTGAYEGSKPSNTGFDNRDFSAVNRAMLWANTVGYTLDAAVPMMLADPTISKSMGGGTRIRTTAAQDLRAVFRQSAQQVLGRDLPDAEVDKFVRAYQGMEAREQTGGATAPAAQVAATEQVQEQYAEEADAMGMYRMAQAANQLFRGLS